ATSAAPVAEPAQTKAEDQIQLVPVPDEAKPVARPEAPAVAAVAPADPRQQAEFELLLRLANQHEEDPAAGVSAWTDFIEKYPHMPVESRAIADQRLEYYQLKKIRASVDLRPKTKEPEF